MIVAVVGPTGVGKTKLSVELAKKYNAVIVNCDAVQVYKELNIGSAKPKEEEKDGVLHLLFDIVNIDDNYTVKDYQKDVRKILSEYSNRNIILVGGTGLYLMAGLYDYEFEEEEESNRYEELTNEELYNLAIQKDSTVDIHKNNRVRLIRFLNRRIVPQNGNNLLYNASFIGLTMPRDILYKRIDDRVDEMMKEGLLEEVQTLYKKCPSARVLKSAIGYKELIDYLNGNVSLEEAVDLIKKNSRHYAKRQYTWFNNKMNINWFNVNIENFSHTINEVENYLENNN